MRIASRLFTASASAILALAGSASADISVIRMGMGSYDLSADGNKALGLIYHSDVNEYFIHRYTRGLGGATSFPGAHPESGSISGSDLLDVFVIESNNVTNWENINCFEGNTAVPQFEPGCTTLKYTSHYWNGTSWNNAGWLPRSLVPGQSYTNGTFDVWVGGTSCDFTTGGPGEMSGNGRYFIASGWTASTAPRADGTGPSGICGPFRIGKFDTLTQTWSILPLVDGTSEYSRGDRTNYDGSVVVGYDYGLSPDPDSSTGGVDPYPNRRLTVWVNNVGTHLNPYENNDGAPVNGPGTVVAGNGDRNYSIANYNQAPIATNDSFTIQRNELLTVPARGILANDIDPAGGLLSGDVPLALTAVSISAPSSGMLAANANGSFEFQPAANFTGAVTFTYKAEDSAGLQSGTATVTINVVNVTTPVAVNDYWAVARGGNLDVSPAIDVGVLVNDMNLPHDGSETAELVTGVSNGSLVFNADGSFQYTPNPNFYGFDSFTYRAKNDSNQLSANIATVHINVLFDPPGVRLMKWTRSGPNWIPQSLGTMPERIVPLGQFQVLTLSRAVKYYPTAISDDGNTICGSVVYNNTNTTFGGTWRGFIWKPTLNGGVPMDFEDYLQSIDTSDVITSEMSVGSPSSMTPDASTFLVSIYDQPNACLLSGGDHIVYTNPVACDQPRISFQPQSEVSSGVPSGFGFVFNVFASGSIPMSYQWQREDPNSPGTWFDVFENPSCSSYSQDMFDYIGTSTAQLRLGGNPSLEGNYRCIITNPCGSVTSAVVNLDRPEIPANDICSTAQSVGLGSYPFNLCASLVNEGVFSSCVTTQTASDGGSDLWYQFVPAVTETVTIESCETESTALDTNITVYPDCSYFPVLACSDDDCPTGKGSKITGFAVTAGVPVIIRLGKPDRFGNTEPCLGVLKIISEAPACPAQFILANFNNTGASQDVIDVVDLFDFLDAWFAQTGDLCTSGCSADVVAPFGGSPDVTDLFDYLDAWFATNGTTCP